MIQRNRLFQRTAPSRDAKVFYVFCEGKSRENDYFRYFLELDSRIKLEVIPPEENEDNSPTGLYNKACGFLIETQDNPVPKYELSDVDEVWFVIDTDKWGDKIAELRQVCCQRNQWLIAQSNPCFEVWLYYHTHTSKPTPADFAPSCNIAVSKHWKSFVNQHIDGGFDSRKHPIFVGEAIKNAQANYSEADGTIDLACTQVYQLAAHFYPYIRKTIEEGLAFMFRKGASTPHP